jgi:acyl-CoA synthetase (AMP-forming)/AMP-acid ligase II/pimeloyl-ACP methyl ester carboxylesterase
VGSTGRTPVSTLRSRAALNIAEQFARIARVQPDRTAIVIATRHTDGYRYPALTFGRCQELADQYAAGFRRHGVRPTQMALILMKPMLDLAPVFLALWRMGVVPVAMDSGGPRSLKVKAIEEIAPEALIGVGLAHLPRILGVRAFRSIRHSFVAGVPGWPGVPSLRSLREWNDQRADDFPATSAEDPMAIVFTTGSTGPPKGVVYTHGNGAAIVNSLRESLQLSGNEICLTGHPAFGMHFLGLGATVILADIDPRRPRAADPARLLRVIQDQKPQVAFLQLSVLEKLVRHCASRREPIPYLRKILVTGAPVSVELAQAVQRWLSIPGADLYIMYGATEALYLASTTGRDLLARSAEILHGAGTYLGHPSEAIDARVIGITGEAIDLWQDSLELPRGEIGEICVRGPMVTSRYHASAEATRRAKIAAGDTLWHRTGDAGYLDEDGGLWFCGRIADRVRTRSGHLYTEFVEPAINTHPEVSRSALVGVPVNGSNRQRAVVLIEPRHRGAQLRAAGPELIAELRSLASQQAHLCKIDDFLFYREAFPLDTRHGAKVRHDLLADYARRELRQKQSKHAPLRAILFQGHRVAFFECGRGDSVLFLHNAGNDHHIWEHQIDYFGPSHRIVAADSLGYGQSGRPAVNYSLPLYTDMVAALVEELSLAPVTIIATCTGAAMALNYSLRHPDRVRQLFLFHIATARTVRGGNLERLTRRLGGRPMVARMLTPLAEGAMTRGVLQSRIVEGQYGLHPEADAEFIQYLQWLYRTPGQASSLLRLFSNWPSFAPLDAIRYPMNFPPLHVLWGEANQVLLVERGRELCQMLGPRTLDIIADGGHLVMREQPQKINERIAELMTLCQKR